MTGPAAPQPGRVFDVLLLDPSPEDTALLDGIATRGHYRFVPCIDDEAMEVPGWDPASFPPKALSAIRINGGRCDGIIAFDDYPFSLIGPMLCQELGLPGLPVRAALLCQHKYWSRVLQQEAVPEVVPRFQLIDSRRDYRAADLALPFPFWLKPVKSYMSYLGYRIGSLAELERALAACRAELPEFTRAFNFVLERAAGAAPPGLAHVDGNYLIAEEFVGGRQCTLEGFVHRNRVHVIGVVDSIRVPGGRSFKRFDYPSRWPQAVQRRMAAIVERFLARIGFDNAVFNAEFFHDPDGAGLKLIEVNGRFSPQFSDMFAKVDGTSTLELMLQLATGQEPCFAARAGRFRRASSFVMRSFTNKLVQRLPTPDEIGAIERAVPGAVVRLRAIEGRPLSEARQDSYSYRYALVNVGGSDDRELRNRFEEVARLLKFEFEAIP